MNDDEPLPRLMDHDKRIASLERREGWYLACVVLLGAAIAVAIIVGIKEAQRADRALSAIAHTIGMESPK